ncbi:hypothetical protein ACLOJK_018255 [Asimina triloba]
MAAEPITTQSAISSVHSRRQQKSSPSQIRRLPATTSAPRSAAGPQASAHLQPRSNRSPPSTADPVMAAPSRPRLATDQHRPSSINSSPSITYSNSLPANDAPALSSRRPSSSGPPSASSPAS